MRILITIAVIFSLSYVKGQELPLGYISDFASDFNGKKIDTNLIFSHTTKARLIDGKLSLSEIKDTLDGFFPKTSAILNHTIFGEYIAELRIKSNITKADSLSGLYLIIGLRDSLNYYFIQMNYNATNFYQTYKGRMSLLTSDSSMILDKSFCTLKIKRDILSRSISITKKGTEIIFSDPNLVMGYFGFGTVNSSFLLDKIIIWAPTSISKPAPLFN